MSDNTATKKSIAESVARDHGMSQAEAERVCTSMLDEIANRLQAGQSVQFRGFGTFEVAERSARQGRNPQTGETVQIPAKRSARFKPAKGLKDLG